ncbi:MAG: hypothetical protein Ct9H300mP9_1000 [Candidatus Neomarinimicrobiota bacterium]|nr:MAG: hypothetical protein Ct9H300mP9_1000 [Candidatus Neomarinimicrobiota bacterium]
MGILNWIPQAVQEISEQISSIPVGPNIAIDESDGPGVISREKVSIQPLFI